METITDNATQQFADDVHDGLSSDPKTLSSKYFYDAQGDKIFQAIMQMPEYYLTNCEYEIFEQQKDKILEAIHTGQKFNLVELGAGDGFKTKLLLEHFIDKGVEFEYYPVDISGDVLFHLSRDLSSKWPDLKVTSLNFEYFKALERLNELDSSPKVILFLGSNIGNFGPAQSSSFFRKLYEVMNEGDLLLCGVDLKKDPQVILDAYNDKAGITRSFNLNLLTRINRELGGNFEVNQFEHYPCYDPFTGEARSYLISKKKQEVFLSSTSSSYQFEYAEPIHMEISRKYSLAQLEQLAADSGFEVVNHFLDCKHYFTDSLWRK